MLHKYYLTGGILLCTALLRAQNFTYTAELQTVTLSGASMYALREDDGTGFIADDIHWSFDGTVNPAAFPSGAVVSASADILLDCPGAPASIYVRGTGPDDIAFPAQWIALSGDHLNYPATPSTTAFASGVARYFDAFSIHWEISFDGTIWHDAGTSANPVYVTLHNAKPESAWSGYKYYLTVFDIACRNADGATSDEEMINMVWSDFTDHSVLRADGVALGYYKYLFSPNVTLPNLIKYADGECYTWAQLFLACLKVHGFSQSNNYMNITADYSGTSCGSVTRFLVKDWTFDTPSNDCDDLPYVNVYSPDYYADADTAYLYDYEEVHDQIGVMGQTAANPASSFSNHQIAIVNGKYYDASYGVLYENFDDIKYGALSGWSRSETSDEVGIGIDVNGDGDLDASPDFTILRATPDLEMANFDPSIETW
ncbi:MAG: hypothetical protein R2794_02545 [Chitinophagales bacterium]